MSTRSYRVEAFVADAKDLLRRDLPLAAAKDEIGLRLAELAGRDDLTRLAAQVGPSDAANATYVLWREPPDLALLLVQFDEGWRSPVHEHGHNWVVGCGYRGADRWDVYERRDDGSVPGHAEVCLVDQVVVEPGVATAIAPPPRSIHSHNNVHAGITQELIFSATPPLSAADRLIYDVDEAVCFPSWFETSSQLQGTSFPPHRFGGARENREDRA